MTGIFTYGPHHIWVSGEDNGLYAGKISYRHLHQHSKLSGSAHGGAALLSRHDLHIHWYHFDKANSPGLASNFITAICVDGRGRLWAGTDRHGVCVFNGKHWKHYSILNGPLGCHVYAIAYDSAANQIWIATENGISIYQCSKTMPDTPASRAIYLPGTAKPGDGVASVTPKLQLPRHTWHYITTANGLPPNPDAMAFDNLGHAYVGTLCNGLAIGRPVLSYRGPPGAMFAQKHLIYRWRVIKGPWHMPLTATGYGLPSNLINCVLVGRRRQHIYVGTDLGLAISTNRGGTFHYIRGSDYAAKVMGLWHPPVGYRPPPKAFLNKLLPGDHITTLAEDAQGNIWVGTWRNGYAVIDARTGQMMKSEDQPQLKGEDGYINRLCPLVIGASTAVRRGASLGSADARPGSADVPSAHTSAAGRQRARNTKIMEAMLIGRYGFGTHCFAGIINGQASAGALAGANPTESSLPHFAKVPTRGQMRRMVAALKKSRLGSDRPVYLGCDWATRGDWTGRYGRQFTFLFATCSPYSQTVAWNVKNWYNLSAAIGPHHHRGDFIRAWNEWFRTKDHRVLWDPIEGHRDEGDFDDHGEAYAPTYSGPNDWVLVRVPAGEFKLSAYFVNYNGHTTVMRRRDYLVSIHRGLPSMDATARTRPLAAARVANYWGGVYQSFLVPGPGVWAIEVQRGSSLNAMIEGVFIDRLAGRRQCHWIGYAPGRYPLPWMGSVAYGWPLPPYRSTVSGAAWVLGDWRAIRSLERTGHGSVFNSAATLAYRAAVGRHAARRLVGDICWRVPIWTQSARWNFEATVHHARQSLKRHMTATPF